MSFTNVEIFIQQVKQLYVQILLLTMLNIPIFKIKWDFSLWKKPMYTLLMSLSESFQSFHLSHFGYKHWYFFPKETNICYTSILYKIFQYYKKILVVLHS